ncbi:MAG: CHAT domain-containing protein [Treponema sp.]|nr:CHAT domain-containing protein [Treponema sp.]
MLEYVLWSPDIAGNTDTKNADIGSYCIVLTQKGVKTVRLDGDYDYAAAVNKLRNKVSGRKQEYQFEQERNELYKHLVAPVLSKLSGIEELVIVPDGCLSFLPFDILRKKDGAKCLGDQYAISFSPSVSVSVIADTHKERTESVLAFGGAWYDKTLSEAEHRRTLRGEGTRGAAKGADRGSLSTDFALTADNDAQLASMRSHIREYGPGDYFAKLTWQDLPGTVAELDTLKNFVFTSGSYDERMQKSASEAELKKLSSSGKLKDYAVLHLACHGYFDRNIADMSSVLFSEVSGKLSGSSQDDGYLTIPETAVLSLDADMVCLSACETGLGEVKRGDGMVGLSRAFMVAGADRVGVSLWCIDDEATAEFMTLMYQKVRQEGKSYSRAYREVKAEFRRSEDFDHPYYWAAFVLYE